MKTKSAAIKHARANVALNQMGGQWCVDTYHPDRRAWYQGNPTDYWQARANYAQACVDSAREFLGIEPVQYDGGPWTSYL